jgi:hypothetical protein
LEVWQQQDQDHHCQANADLTPDRLEVRQQQDRDRYAQLTPDQLEFVHRGSETLLTTLPCVDTDIIDRVQVQFIGRRGLPEDANTFL